MKELKDTNRNDSCDLKESKRRKMINEIKALNFSIIELGLYLDTHPCDTRALKMHNDYSVRVKELKDEYQKAFGPLTIFYPDNKWSWIESPWPWERGNF